MVQVEANMQLLGMFPLCKGSGGTWQVPAPFYYETGEQVSFSPAVSTYGSSCPQAITSTMTVTAGPNAYFAVNAVQVTQSDGSVISAYFPGYQHVMIMGRTPPPITPTPSPTPSASPTPVSLIVMDCDYQRKLGDHPQKVVGEYVDLRVVSASNPSCADYSVRSATWSLPGSTIGGYTRSPLQGRVLPMPAQAPEMKFYWTAATSGTIQVRGTLSDGRSGAGAETITVLAPTEVNVTIAPTPLPTILEDDKQRLSETLAYGTYDFANGDITQELKSANGMHWKFSVTGPADPDGTGEIDMIQLVNALDQEHFRDGEANAVFDTKGAALPDEGCIL